MKDNEIYKMYQDRHPMAKDKMIGFTPLAINCIIVSFNNMKDKVLVTLHERTNLLSYNILRYDDTQEAKEVSNQNNGDAECPNCNHHVYYFQKHCVECGQALKWNDDK